MFRVSLFAYFILRSFLMLLSFVLRSNDTFLVFVDELWFFILFPFHRLAEKMQGITRNITRGRGEERGEEVEAR
jgi:hypothetical protein